jgi:hypothetical protein
MNERLIHDISWAVAQRVIGSIESGWDDEQLVAAFKVALPIVRDGLITFEHRRRREQKRLGKTEEECKTSRP